MTVMKKKIIVAFDSFKGCISAKEACEAATEEIRSVLPNANVIQLPLSDGGEGLVECIKRLLPTIDVSLTVHGPLMEKVTCSYAISLDGKTAYMEMAAASGLTLVPEDKRNPMEATTYGVGEMIKDADIVITGEGKSDTQTLMGKVPHGVLKRCLREGVEVWLLSGAIDDPKSVLSRHFSKVKSINENDSRPLEQLLLPEVAKENLRNTVKRTITNK